MLYLSMNDNESLFRTYLVGQMRQQVVIIVNEIVHSQAQIPMTEQGQDGLRTRYAHVASDVELLLIYKQRIVYILLDNSTGRLIPAELLHLLTVVLVGQLLTQLLRGTDQVDARLEICVFS